MLLEAGSYWQAGVVPDANELSRGDQTGLVSVHRRSFSEWASCQGGCLLQSRHY